MLAAAFGHPKECQLKGSPMKENPRFPKRSLQKVWSGTKVGGANPPVGDAFCLDVGTLTFLPTSGFFFSMKPLKVKLVAGEQKATESTVGGEFERHFSCLLGVGSGPRNRRPRAESRRSPNSDPTVAGRRPAPC